MFRIKRILFFILLFAKADMLSAAEETYFNELRGATVAPGSVLVVTDEKFRTCASMSCANMHIYDVKNYISFELNTDTSLFFYNKPFTATLNVTVHFYADQSDTTHETSAPQTMDLSIRFDTVKGGLYKGAALYKFEGARKFRVVINSITSPEYGSGIPAVFRLTGKTVIQRQYDFEDNSTDVSVFQPVNDNQLRVSWTPANYPGAEQFDLEWMVVDSLSAIADTIRNNLTTINANVLNRWFRNNASRITTNASSYVLNLAYHAGYLLYRLRGVQLHYGDNIRYEGNWNYSASTSVGGTIQHPIAQIGWHQSNLNWQYTAGFAEDGKRKEVIQYFDGSLRNRQAVTLDNSNQVAVVQETVYDPEGRAAASILPAPVNESRLRYFPSFNLNNSLAPYSFSDLQTGINCQLEAGVFSTSSGAAQYYSSGNPFTTLHRDHIPSAEGYPVAVTAYTPDQTGRIASQGGVGAEYQPGSGHETKYFYGKPTQTELDRMFGSEAGIASHYLKNMVVDPNGQISVSYVNAGGKTIATALAGKAPDSLSALPAAANASVQVTNELINNDNFLADPVNSSLSASATFLAPVTGNYAFTYHLVPEQLVMRHGLGNRQKLCSSCYYDLKIEVKDNCNNLLSSRTRPAGLLFDTSCTALQPIIDSFVTPISSIGEYYVSYELVVSKNALSFYDSVNLAKNTRIRPQAGFLSEELRKMDFSDCFNDCKTCVDDLGTVSDFIQRFRILYERETTALSAGDSIYIAGLHGTLLAQCIALRQSGACISPCEDKLRVIKMDIRPGGQYALYDTANLQPVDPQEINVLTKYSTVQGFPDENGLPDSVTIKNIAGEDSVRLAVNQLPLSYFIANWKDSWGDSLAKFHPEYCYYLWCQDQGSYYGFDEVVKNAMSNSSSAIGLGYFSTTDYAALLKKDPFFDPANRGGDSTFYKQMNESLRLYSRLSAGLMLPDKNILEFVHMNLYCRNTGSPWDGCMVDDSCRSYNREWELYKQYYFGLKENFYERARLATPGFTDCKNCYIGQDALGMSNVAVAEPLESPPGGGDCNLTPAQFHLGSAVLDGEGNFTVPVFYSGAQQPITANVYIQIEYQTHSLDTRTLDTVVNFIMASTGDTILTCPVNGLYFGGHISSVECISVGPGGPPAIIPGSNDTTYFIPPVNCINNCAVDTIYEDYARPGISYYIGFGSRQSPPSSVPPGYTNGAFYAGFVVSTGPDAFCEFSNIWVFVKDEAGNDLPADLPSSDCGTHPDAALYANKTRRFADYTNTTAFNAQMIASNSQNQQQLQMQMSSMYLSNAEAMVNAWMRLLGNCVHSGDPVEDSTKLEMLRTEFINIFVAGAHTGTGGALGIMSAPDSTAFTYKTFEAAIKGILGNDAVNSSCAVELLTGAYFYNKQPVYSLPTISETDYDICTRLGQFKQAYAQSGFSGSMYAYLQKELGSALVISESQLDDMERSCTGCFNILKNETPLPVPFISGRKNSVSCDSLLLLRATFESKFPGYDTLETWLQHRLLTNYYNQQLGFALTYYDYKEYLDSSYCNGGNGPARVYDIAMTPQAEKNTNTCIAELFTTAASNARLRYTVYIDSVRNDFREAYLNRCMAAQANLQLRADLFEYHYTLYYYDQSGNLVKTIPPAGVTLLNQPQVDSVQLDRKYNKGNCYTYADNLLFDGVAGKLFSGRSQYNMGVGGFTIEQYIWPESHTDQALLGFYDTAARSGYRLFIKDDSLVLRMQQNDTAWYQATAGSVQEYLPLQQWTHLAVTHDPLTWQNLLGERKVNIIINGNSIPVTVSSQYFNNLLIVGPGPGSGAGLQFGVDSAMPVFEGRMKQVRLYQRALGVQEARQNYTNTCLLPAKQDALVFWAPVNEGAGQFEDVLTGDTSTNIYGSLAWLRNRMGIYPAHTLPTVYEYNSLDQVVRQQTPDAGQSRFWYDRLGRLTASQNSEQHQPANGGGGNRYSYTRYDAQGRIIEVGEKTGATDITSISAIDSTALANWLNTGNDYQVTYTLYDAVNTGLVPYTTITQNQQYLRKRVVSTLYKDNAGASGYDNATHYTYDINGNVRTLWQEIGKLRPYSDNGIKRIDYDYDLVSGKVNQVIYQPGKGDQFIYRYSYDAENRLTAARSSRDSLVWNTDAEYRYYLHGPLARTELGTHKVQGIDYAYTLQGWLKGMNTTNLAGETNSTGDMGGDAQNGSRVSKDVAGFALHYNHTDYTPINNSRHNFAALPVLGTAGLGGLYNGNINAMSVSLHELTPVINRYGYDQLNRLVSKQVYSGLDTFNRWTPVALDDYAETLSYDPNGNILTNTRNGHTGGSNPLQMDNLQYHYQPNTNKLNHVTDAVAAGNYSIDIDSQNADNYAYDKIGNLMADEAEGLQNIQWTVYGKIKTIIKADNTIQYAYDAAGSRVYKKSGNSETVYVRDAQGNALAVYSIRNDSTLWAEQHLYGSSRIGIYNYGGLIPAQPVAVSTPGITINDSLLAGSHTYELTNHLSNVLAVISDKKIGVASESDSSLTKYYAAEVLNVQDYYAFGMLMPGRNYPGEYRYGFNGKENDNEVKGIGNQQDYGLRIYDLRLGKFLSVDPISKDYPELTPYQFASNSPIENSDLDGAEALSEIKAGLAKKWDMQMKIASINDANKKAKESQTRAMMRYLATVPPTARANTEISKVPKKVSNKVKQLRREHHMDAETGKKTAMGRLFMSKTYQNLNDNVVEPMAHMAVGEGAGRLLFKGGSLLFKFEQEVAAKTGSSFFQGTKYTNKVLGQMKSEPFHAFPESVKAFESSGVISTIKGGDGITRQMLKIPGEYGGKKGFFEFIKEADGSINHRFFRPNP